MTKTTKKVAKKTTAKTNLKTPALLRKGFRAYIGLYGAAYEAAQTNVVPAFNKAAKNATKNYDEFAQRGEKLELLASTYANDTRKTVTDFAKARFEKRSAQLRAFVPTLQTSAANDRVTELEAEIAKLNKKIATKAKTVTKKTSKVATNVAKATTKKTPKAA